MSYLRYNLQLFAKDGPGGEKTEPATQKKLDDARKEGQVAKSTEIVNAIYLLVIFYVLKFLLGMMGEGILESFTTAYGFIPTYAAGSENIVNVGTTAFIMKEIFLKIIVILLPVFAITFLLNFVLNVAQVKWKPTGKPLQPKFNKLSPMRAIRGFFQSSPL